MGNLAGVGLGRAGWGGAKRTEDAHLALWLQISALVSSN